MVNCCRTRVYNKPYVKKKKIDKKVANCPKKINLISSKLLLEESHCFSHCFKNSKKGDPSFPEAFELGQRMKSQDPEETLIPFNRKVIQERIKKVHRMIMIQFSSTNVEPTFAFDANGEEQRNRIDQLFVAF